MRKKYPIHSDFKRWTKLNPPINRFALFFVRHAMNLFFTAQKSDKQCMVKKIKIPFNDKKIRAIIFSPLSIKENSPCLIYYHGGGFVMPASPHHYHNARKYALEAQCKVVFVDYPLAPKNKYPIPAQASFETYKWVMTHAKELSVDKTRIAVGGDSAGGNLSAVVSLMAHDNNIQMPCGQMLLYPAIGLDFETQSMKEFVDTPMCNSRDIDRYIKMYLKSEQDKQTRYVSPIRAESFDVYPTSFVETAEFDCLRDEAIFFACMLKIYGVKTHLHKTKGTMHGYDIVEKSPITQNSLQKRIEFLKSVFR